MNGKKWKSKAIVRIRFKIAMAKYHMYWTISKWYRNIGVKESSIDYLIRSNDYLDKCDEMLDKCLSLLKELHN